MPQDRIGHFPKERNRWMRAVCGLLPLAHRIERAFATQTQDTIRPILHLNFRKKSLLARPSKRLRKNKGLIDKRSKHGALAVKAACLIRDTTKAFGRSEDLGKPICAFFYVDISDRWPDAPDMPFVLVIRKVFLWRFKTRGKTGWGNNLEQGAAPNAGFARNPRPCADPRLNGRKTFLSGLFTASGRSRLCRSCLRPRMPNEKTPRRFFLSSKTDRVMMRKMLSGAAMV